MRHLNQEELALETKIINLIVILFISINSFAVDEGCLKKAIDGIEASVVKLPPGADDFFRKRMKVIDGSDPTLLQVEALVKANKKLGLDKAAGEKILRDSGQFTEEQIQKIVANSGSGFNSPELSQKAANVAIAAREVPAPTDALKTTPPPTSQSSAPRTDTPSAQLADAMNTGKDVQGAFQRSREEVNQIMAKTGGNNLSVDQLADFSTRGLKTDDAVLRMKSALSNEADFNKAMSTIDRKIASVGSGPQAEYSAAQMQELKVKAMEAYYAQKFKVKPGYSVIEALDDDAADAFSAANERLAQLQNAKNKKNWPK